MMAEVQAEMDFLEFDTVQTISQSLQTYVLEWESGEELEGRREAMALAVMKRAGGLLLALPISFLSEEELAEADTGDNVLGPSVVLTLPGVVIVDGQESPIGTEAELLVVDADQEICRFMRPFQRSGEAIAECFFPDDPFAVPSSGELLAKTMGWLQSYNPAPEVEWYANEVTAESTPPATPKATPQRSRRPKARYEFRRRQTKKNDDGFTGSFHSDHHGDSAGFLRPDSDVGGSSVKFGRAGGERKLCGISVGKAPFSFSGKGSSEVSGSSGEFDEGPSKGACSSTDPSRERISSPSSARVGEGEELGGASKLRSCKGHDGPECGDHFFGGSDSGKQFGPHAGVAGDFVRYKRSFGPGEVAGGIGSAQGNLFPLCGSFDGSANGSDLGGRSAIWSVDGSWHFRNKILRTVWRIWSSTRPGPGPISADEHLRFHDGRKHRGSKRQPCPFDCHGGTSLHRSGSVRPWTGAHAARRLTGGCVHKPPAESSVSSSQFCPSSRPKMDYGCLGFPERIGYNLGEESRTPCRIVSYYKWRRSFFSDSKRSRQRKSKEEGQRTKRKLPATGGGEGVAPLPASYALDTMNDTMDFTGWALCLPRWVLATRSDFGWNLLRSFSLKWHGQPMLSAVYPLPAPFPGCFDGSGPGLSKRKLGVVARKRLCHTLIIVLNYLALGRFATLAELGRPPNGMQTRCIKRLYDMVTACGYRPDRFPVVPGRSGFELIACLDRLERFLDDATTFGHGYDIGTKLPLARDHDLEEKQMEEHPQLRPFRPLCAERLKITGCGKWPLEDYLESVLWLPYVEPGILRHGADVSHLPGPVFGSEDRSENLRLARKWDELGLLRLHSCPSEDWPFSRVFNIYKSEQVDRQIGDRRNMNKVECHAGGPSSRLPPGPLLVNIFCLRGRQNLRGSVTDRRDFYHQAKASKSRSLSNLLPFGYRRDELVGLSALSAFEEENLKKPKGRLYEGDHFESRRGLLAGGEEHLFCGFAALFQGDHLGVEFALEGHETLLKGEGLLHEPDRLQGHSVLPLDECYEALIIDDYFCISAQGREVESSSSESFKRLQRARFAYQKHELPGSPEKDVVAETLFKAAGAEVDSNEAVVELGLCLVGAP